MRPYVCFSKHTFKTSREESYCIYPKFCLLCSLFLPDISIFLFSHFHFVETMSFSHYLRVVLFATNSLTFFLIWDCLDFLLNSWKMLSLHIRFWVNIFHSALEKYVSLLFSIQWFLMGNLLSLELFPP